MSKSDNVARWTRFVGYLQRQIETLGQWDRKERRLLDLTKATYQSVTRMPSDGRTPEEKREIRRALMLDALAWSFEELIAGKPVYAFRGLLQAREHESHCGHNVVSKDASIELQNAIEDVLTGRDS